MDVRSEVLRMLDEVLSLAGRSAGFTPETPLLGAVPELDSMAVVALINYMEERLGLSIEDDEIDASCFATVGALTDFVADRVH